ncbi:DedA family protein [Lentzea sp. NPDC004789]
MNVIAVNILDPHSLLATFGPVGVFVVMFAETGLLVGFFLPGDSLLFTAGLVSATALHLSLGWVVVAAAAGAILGAQTGYYLGRAAGPRLLTRPDKPKLVQATQRAEETLTKYGVGKAIVLARFIPLVRTVLNPLAGALRVPVGVFTVWQVVGGLLWAVSLPVAGHLLGSRIPNIDTYLLPIIGVIVLLSAIPVLRELLKARKA